jgi:Fic family protein
MNYKWTITQEIDSLVNKLEEQKKTLESQKQLPHLELLLRKKSLLKSSIYSARIEGFPDEESSPKKESQNLLTAYNLVHSGKIHNFSLEHIKNIHLLVLTGISSSAGSYRNEPWAIFDQSGNAIYLAPMHFEIPKLMDDYIDLIIKTNEHPAVVAAIAQYVFEKIHPFPDGNGRVGRLLSSLVLSQRGYGLRGLIPFEQYIESHRTAYYQSLESNTDATDFILYFLQALTSEIDMQLQLYKNLEEKPEDLLLPRRREILNIISNHPLCTFDMIKRRFISVNEKTLHYDIFQLLKKGYIKKIGTTRGAMYKRNDNL